MQSLCQIDESHSDAQYFMQNSNLNWKAEQYQVVDLVPFLINLNQNLPTGELK